MAVSYAYARQFVGKAVVCDCHDGMRHYGIVHHVTPTHLRIAPIRPSVRLASHTMDKEFEVTTLEQAGKPWIVPTYYPLGYAGLALPLYTILALSLFWW
ncbi:hypothetical protein [Thermicanus aegyptius]|uniref:hypothetical protein n=1 Tax=Thermicanus aegyptius TaxID=94009 RepID=UPI00048B7E62|nr:hypothetical protein [Thermicanus aegyptius]